MIYRYWGISSLEYLKWKKWIQGNVQGCACFAEIASELTKTWSSGATECRVWIGNCNVKVWKSTQDKLHKIWNSKYFGQISAKRAHPREYWGFPHARKNSTQNVKDENEERPHPMRGTDNKRRTATETTAFCLYRTKTTFFKSQRVYPPKDFCLDKKCKIVAETFSHEKCNVNDWLQAKSR